MKVQKISIDKLIPYDNNPRDNADAVEAVANSIEAFGFQQPIVVDKDNVVIVGHTRLLAAEMLGMDVVPVVVADLTREEAAAYRIADNRTGEMAAWDMLLLRQEVASLSESPDLSLDVLGFSEGQLEKLLTPESPETLVDGIEDTKQKASSERDTSYYLGRHVLHCSDLSPQDMAVAIENATQVGMSGFFAEKSPAKCDEIRKSWAERTFGKDCDWEQLTMTPSES